MVLWISFAVLCALVLAVIVRPLMRRPDAEEYSEHNPELAIYRDQLAELERDVERGVIRGRDAEAAKAEISRRLIAASEQEDSSNSVQFGAKPVAAITIFAIVGITLATYLSLGSPDQPGAPLKQRVAQAADGQDFQALVTQVEAQLEKAPNDARGWMVIAPAYQRLRRHEDAVDAYRRAVNLIDKPEADLLTAFGEAIVISQSGLVTAEAKQAFTKALELDPKFAKARFFEGLSKVQDGDTQGALKVWKSLLVDAPSDAPWRQTVMAHISQIEQPNNATPGPDRETVAAAQDMSPEDRQAMIVGMVEGLAEKLEQDGSDLNSWMRLIRARMVLKQTDQARDAYKKAQTHFTGNEQALAQLKALAQQMGLES
ncbi:MAG: c-type cytochrome biogenesis protein CcmI [Hyphomicrobiales bacterium]